MRQLTLTNAQFAALYDILEETVEYIEGDEYKVGKLLDWTED